MRVSVLNSPWASLFALLGIFALSFLLTVDGVMRIPLCLFHLMSNLDCPGCGLTRSFISISHGDLLSAVRFNALGPVLYIFFLFLLLKLIYRLLNKEDPAFLQLKSLWIYYLFGLLFWGQWILKLIHGWRQASFPLLS